MIILWDVEAGWQWVLKDSWSAKVARFWERSGGMARNVINKIQICNKRPKSVLKTAKGQLKMGENTILYECNKDGWEKFMNENYRVAKGELPLTCWMWLLKKKEEMNLSIFCRKKATLVWLL